MHRHIHDTYSCEVCGKPVSRLFGVGAVVTLPDERVQLKTAAIGYCATHKDQAIPAWLMTVTDAAGDVRLLGEPEDLRPSNASDFLASARTQLAEAVGGLHQLEPGAAVPDECPHCGGNLSWGRGPHARDSEVAAGRAASWECTDCGAAGMLMKSL